MRGPNDPHRAEKIIDAALRIISTHGVEGLTHRAIAAEASVPLGSTTYYFATRDDILVAAMESATLRWTEGLIKWVDSIPSKADLARALTDRVVDLTQHAAETAAYYKLYLAAEGIPALQDRGYAWSTVMMKLLQRFVSSTTAEVVSAVYDALVLRGVVGDPRINRSDVQRLFDYVLAASPSEESSSLPRLK